MQYTYSRAAAHCRLHNAVIPVTFDKLSANSIIIIVERKISAKRCVKLVHAHIPNSHIIPALFKLEHPSERNASDSDRAVLVHCRIKSKGLPAVEYLRYTVVLYSSQLDIRSDLFYPHALFSAAQSGSSAEAVPPDEPSSDSLS